MSMVVRTNTMAIGANSALNKNNSTVAGNLQKLSSGFRINRAADDASGLAVSEKMKAQIKALDQASKNAQDGASLIKTAEGYMGEIHDMLNRIVELAEKSANGTYETNMADGKEQTAAQEKYGQAGVDRQAIQDEVDQLTTEINRIAKTANFNGLKLLDGSLDAGTVSSTTTPDDGDDTPVDYDVTSLYIRSGTAGNYTYAPAGASAEYDENATYATQEVDYTNKDSSFDEEAFNADGKTNLWYKGTEANAEWTQVTNSDTYQSTGTYASRTVTYNDIEDMSPYVKQPENSGDDDGGETPTATTGAALKLQIGETSGAADKLEVSIKSFKTDDLFKNLDKDVITQNKSAAATTADFENTLTINVSNQESASKAAEEVRKVINEVSSRRATLGAMENRLDYTMNNLDTASQNITDANSRIRDTDMAKTMMEYTQGNTLTQAAQAMLAQANQAPSQVLQLLQ